MPKVKTVKGHRLFA